MLPSPSIRCATEQPLSVSVLAQTFNDHEIVVLDDGWGDPPEIEGCLLAERTGSIISDKPTRDTEHALQVSESATRRTDGRQGVR